MVHRLEEIQAVVVHTTRGAVRCTDKSGPLAGAPDRDSCLQYAVAVALLYGTVTSEHFTDAVAADPRIDELRRKFAVYENPQVPALAQHTPVYALIHAVPF